MYQGARRPGKVLSVNDKRSIFKIRFDEFPTAEFDYSFSYKSPAWSYIGTPPPSSSSSSSIVETAENTGEPLFSIARKFKALIKVGSDARISVADPCLSSMSYSSLCCRPTGI